MTYEERREQSAKLHDVAYYLIIALVSILSLVFIPLLSSNIVGGFDLPKSIDEWMIWVVSRLAVAAVNVMIFYCFIEQAKVNVRNNENFKKAQELSLKTKNKKELQPRSPKTFMFNQWTRKGTLLVISSLLTTIVLTEAVIKFDMVTFSTYLFTVSMGVAFGYLTMRKNEDYWTSEYLEYTLTQLKEEKINA